MKIIIVGCGKVGRNIAEVLVQENHDLVLVDSRSEIVEELSNSLDVLGVIGEATNLPDLKEAGTEIADILLAVTSSDETNMLCCLFARKLNPNIKTIARVRNYNYSSKEINYIKDELGLTLVINPEMETAREISRILRLPAATQVNTFSRNRVEIVTFTVNEGNVLINKKVSEIFSKTNGGILLAGIERDNDIIIPHGDTVILENDNVSVVARPLEIESFFSQIGLVKNPIKNVTICGGSAIAYYLTYQLQRSKVNVKIIERDRERCEHLAEILPNATIICGDGTDNNLLLEEGLKEADAFVSLTNVDEENVMLSLFAKSVSDKKVVTKVNHISYDSVISKLDLGSIVYPKDIAADKIISYVRGLSNADAYGSNITSLYRIMNNKAEALTIKITDEGKITNKPLKDIQFKDDLLICSIIRNDEVITPSGSDVLNVGDTVIVVTSNKGFDSIEDIVK